MAIIKKILWLFSPCDQNALQNLDKGNEHIKNIQM
jgi:hypothetical protein